MSARARRLHRHRHGAFTLVELMVVLAVGAVLLAAGVPAMGELIARHRLRTTAADLFAAIDLTRSQAIARGRRVLLMPLDPSGTDWNQGWAVFVDKNASLGLDPDDELIFRQGPVATGIVIRAAFSSPHPPSYIAYNSAGRSCGASNSMAARWGTVSVQAGPAMRHIKINMLGRVRICDPAAEPATCSGLAAE